jgi:hypothetical protein
MVLVADRAGRQVAGARLSAAPLAPLLAGGRRLEMVAPAQVEEVAVQSQYQVLSPYLLQVLSNTDDAGEEEVAGLSTPCHCSRMFRGAAREILEAIARSRKAPDHVYAQQ